ncbi:hypothetical protein [Clostridium sp.]|uniref:hypothetical protein n=1 Tax=Clostridium sp. TaxID=1506 RepID=UPI00283BED8F|nr:hypothetical protein [Clostridium sp.]MDR3598138.1 hypothetical protein [Clostridium sp.]
MYADLFSQNGKFELWKTTDLNVASWTNVTGFSLPSGTKHASVVSVTQAELNKIKSTY